MTQVNIVEACQQNCDDIREIHRKLAGMNRLVYRLSEATAANNMRTWNRTGDGLPHDRVGLIFTGPIDTLTGFPAHPNPASADVTTNSWQLGAGAAQIEIWGWIELTEPTLLRDANTNTGELAEVWVSEFCGPARMLQQTNTPTSALTQRTILDPVLLPAGIHMIYVIISDFDLLAGFQLEQSNDGGTTWGAFSGRSWSRKPTVECQLVPVCNSVPVGWSELQPKLIDPVINIYPTTDAAGDTFPANPLDGQEFWRTDLRREARFDATLGLWLGEIEYEGYGANGNVNNNVYLRRFNGMQFNANSGVAFPYNVIIQEHGVDFQTPAGGAIGGIEIEIDGNNVLHTLPIQGLGPYHEEGLSIVLPANEVMAFRRDGTGNINNVQGYIRFRRVMS